MYFAQGTVDVVDVVRFDPSLDEVVCGGEHEKIRAHSLRFQTIEKGLYLRFVDALVSDDGISYRCPFFGELSIVHISPVPREYDWSIEQMRELVCGKLLTVLWKTQQ